MTWHKGSLHTSARRVVPVLLKGRAAAPVGNAPNRARRALSFAGDSVPVTQAAKYPGHRRCAALARRRTDPDAQFTAITTRWWGNLLVPIRWCWPLDMQMGMPGRIQPTEVIHPDGEPSSVVEMNEVRVCMRIGKEIRYTSVRH